VPCAADADCNDGNACTADACVNGACTASPIPGCGPCTTDGDCNDGDACTADACVAGTCGHTAIPDCGSIGGGGGKPKEICGDCIDNDGDGLVDFDDPDCCDTTMPLDLKRLAIKTPANPAAGMRLKIRGGFAPQVPAGFDPMTANTTVMITDASGVVFCRTMPAAAWQHPNSKVFRFRDKTGTIAGGINRSRFKMLKSGPIKFRTNGKHMADIRRTDGQNVKVTIAVGGKCSTAVMQLRSKPHAVVFP
jgi:hypothetical protein